MAEHAPRSENARHAEVRQDSLAQILGVWAAAAIPMGLLACVVAPLLEDQLEGDEPFLRRPRGRSRAGTRRADGRRRPTGSGREKPRERAAY
jgi:hypothetical protein